MSEVTLFACCLCRFSPEEKSRDDLSGGEHLLARVQAELKARNLQERIAVRPLRCMAACSRGCNVTLAAPGKLTFVLSGLSPTESAVALSEFCEQYVATPEGKVPYRERSAIVREATALILPPLPYSPPQQ
ncbi:DUF1636 domain-containing protein [Oxynema aestuarii]|jgi:predicted metal-binding protein|uniref:DUF1636 domain-containing protein n=1 Tax=Oxynema aestuarii AP17 TaxID=2064643 RepID=A0A6H1TZ78_9CYAN|nr:DUF1636 domain-containing protein [Oxynema aestuarii]QIZ70659.1 DUF1636 domain-containing protein [Oxynema aestuarii AP17]RMH76222.1 MAG: DUF1636 domain-containing protein [Cyanobacteria bacterium J007]